MATKEKNNLKVLVDQEIKNVKANRWLSSDEKEFKVLQLTKLISDKDE